jgi:hypothetical protein
LELTTQVDGYYLNSTGKRFQPVRLIEDHGAAGLWLLTDQQHLYQSGGDNVQAYAAGNYISYILPVIKSDIDIASAAGWTPLTCAYTNDILSCANGNKNNLFLIREGTSEPVLGSATDVTATIKEIKLKKVCS